MQPPPGAVVLRPGLADLARLYPWFAALAEAQGLRDEDVFGAHLALEEAATNAALHGFEPGAGGMISVRATFTPGSVTPGSVTPGSVTPGSVTPGFVTIVVRDDGKPFDPTTAPELAASASLEEAAIGGRGLRLLRHYCASMRYRRLDEQNELTLTVLLKAQPARPDGGGR